MDNIEGAWILAMITMVGAVFAGLFKLVSKNGCSVSCAHSNGNNCCTTDCEEGRAPVNRKTSNKEYSNHTATEIV
jgi:hypothetical protein